MANGEGFFRGLRSQIFVISAERDEWYNLANEASVKLTTAEVAVALRWLLLETDLEEVDAHTVGIAQLQGQLTAKDAKLPEMCAKNSKLADELG